MGTSLPDILAQETGNSVRQHREIKAGMTVAIVDSEDRRRSLPWAVDPDRAVALRRTIVHWLSRPAGLLPSVTRAFDTPPGSVRSLLPAGVCYRALWRLPEQDLHLLERRVFQGAP
jgi:hypothetical protein